MFMVNDLLKMTDKGFEKYGHKFGIDDDFLVSMYFEEDADFPEFFVVSNLKMFETHPEPIKPLKLSLNAITRCFKPKLDEDKCALTYFPDELRELSDEELREKRPTWLETREQNSTYIEPFINKNAIWRYLAEDLGADIAARANFLKLNHKAIRRPLNRYLSLGSKIALLPIKFINTGKGPRVYTKKPGIKERKDGKPVLSQTRVISIDDREKIRRLVWANRLDVTQGAVVIRKLHTLFQKQYCSTPGYVTKQSGVQVPTLILDEKQSINERQFARLVKQVFLDNQLSVIKNGEQKHNNNRRDKTGSAREGLHASAFYFEIDSTPLPIYLAYPLNQEKRESAGKVYLCLVGCVSTHLVAGFSLSFAPPNWENVMEALLNCVQNKVEFAARYGITIDEDDWPSQHFPRGVRVDNGPENAFDNVREIVTKIVEKNVGIQVHCDGISDADWCPPGEPALKGTIENLINIIQLFLANAPGTVDKRRDGSHQHASQNAILQKDDINRLIITAITIHNTTAVRSKLITREMGADEVDLTPSAMWQYIVNHPLYGRPKISQRDLPRYLWKMLRKHTVRVTSREVVFQKLGYYSEWAEKEQWFSRANHQGVYTVEMVAFGGLVDTLYFKDERNELQVFTLTRDYEQFRGMSLQQANERQRQIDERAHELNWQRNQALVNLENLKVTLRINGESFYENAPLNHAKSIQKDIDKRNDVMIADEQRQRAQTYQQILTGAVQPSTFNFSFDDTSVGGDDDFGDVS
jgi:putative transposase